MKRVVVIGSGGAGKSTFSRKLGEITGLPVVHLDKLYWHSGWVKTPREEWLPVVEREMAKPEWIMDGNYGNTRVMRMQAADTIILLDLPRYVCMYRILKRALTYREGSRPDMADGCREKIDPEFILWVWNYKNRGREHAMREISELEGKRVVILKNQKQIDEFLRDPYAN
ncbi:MAG: DNA topology modulation protein [Acidobacteria bacterium]|nr:DNA topology modulation protein [Acidobacteriota bacterium]